MLGVKQKDGLCMSCNRTGRLHQNDDIISTRFIIFWKQTTYTKAFDLCIHHLQLEGSSKQPQRPVVHCPGTARGFWAIGVGICIIGGGGDFWSLPLMLFGHIFGSQNRFCLKRRRRCRRERARERILHIPLWILQSLYKRRPGLAPQNSHWLMQEKVN